MLEAIVFIYLAFVVGFGIYIARRNVHDDEDFVVAGRSLSRAVVTGTLIATFIGSGTIIGGASFAYQHGPLATIFFFSGIPIGILILYFVLAEKIRKAKASTIPEIIERQYGAGARALSALVILLAYLGVVSYQFIGAGYALNLAVGMPVWAGSLVSCLIIIVLATAGGLVSVAYTDFVSSIIIFFSLLIAMPLVLTEVGGPSGLYSALPDTKQGWFGGLSFLQILGYFLPLLLFLLGDQNLYQRFSASRDVQTARRSAAGFLIGSVLITGMVTVLASAVAVLFPHAKPDTAMMVLATKGVPGAVGGCLLAAIIALIVTTGNSYLLSCSANLTHDFYQTISKHRMPSKQGLLFNRATVVVLGLLAYGVGTFFPSVLAIQMYSYTMYGAAITPVVVAALIWKRASMLGGILALLAGGTTTIMWDVLLNQPMDLNSVLFSLPTAVILLIGVSLAFPATKSDLAPTR